MGKKRMKVKTVKNPKRNIANEIKEFTIDNPTKVVVISGHAQSGKDATARLLCRKLVSMNKRALVVHYADLLKYICQMYFVWDGKKTEEGRELLQYVGTDIIRNQNENYWVDFVGDMLSYFNHYWDYVLIPDARFPNEVDRLKERGFDVTHIRIERPNHNSILTDEQKSHSSETALDNVEPDKLVINDGTLKDLKKKANQLAEEV